MADRTTSKTRSKESTSRSSNDSSRASSNGRGNGSATAKGGSSSSSNKAKGKESQEGLMKLFLDQLADVLYVEKKLVKQLPKMADKCESEGLAQAFTDHLAETENQVERLEECFELLDRAARGKTCEAMDGILAEAKELMDEFKGDPALDAAIICAAQKVEHYEISTYGSLRAFAEELGLTEIAGLLQETLDEEEQADSSLSELAEARVNAQANGEGSAHAMGSRNGATKAAKSKSSVSSGGRKSSIGR